MSNIYQYHLYKVAQERFNCKPKELSVQDNDTANCLARRTIFIENRILDSDEAHTVSVDRNDVQNARQALIDSYDNHSSFLEDLRENGLDEELLCIALSRQLKVERIIEKVLVNVEKPSDSKIEDFYRCHKSKFHQPEQRSVSHILITINPDFVENSFSVAQRRIRDLHSQIIKNPISFNKLAETHSECPSALQGGTLGSFSRGRMMKPLEDAAFKLKQGEISAPVETEVGFHIVRCDRIILEHLVSLKEAWLDISKAIYEERREKKKKLWIKTLCATKSVATATSSSGSDTASNSSKNTTLHAT
ncbi:MAG: Chaperone SurA [Hyphomicrobiaceae bacterium hypho_1]